MTEIYRGDIYYIMPFYTVTGSEQRAGRPGVVVSNDINNRHSPNVEIVFLTSQEKKPLPTHVPVMCRVPSTALCENIQTVSVADDSASPVQLQSAAHGYYDLRECDEYARLPRGS